MSRNHLFCIALTGLLLTLSTTASATWTADPEGDEDVACDAESAMDAIGLAATSSGDDLLVSVYLNLASEPDPDARWLAPLLGSLELDVDGDPNTGEQSSPAWQGFPDDGLGIDWFIGFDLGNFTPIDGGFEGFGDAFDPVGGLSEEVPVTIHVGTANGHVVLIEVPSGTGIINVAEQVQGLIFFGDGAWNVCDVVPDQGHFTVGVCANGDSDGDGICDESDNCPDLFNPIGEDICEEEVQDRDSDGIPDDEDNCPYIFNPDQENEDGDRYGDECDDTPNCEGSVAGRDGRKAPSSVLALVLIALLATRLVPARR